MPTLYLSVAEVLISLHDVLRGARDVGPIEATQSPTAAPTALDRLSGPGPGSHTLARNCPAGVIGGVVSLNGGWGSTPR